MVDFLPRLYLDLEIHSVTLDFDAIEFTPVAQEHLTVVLRLIFSGLVVDVRIFHEYTVSEEGHPVYVDLINLLAYFISSHLLGFIICHCVVCLFGSRTPQ